MFSAVSAPSCVCRNTSIIKSYRSLQSLFPKCCKTSSGNFPFGLAGPWCNFPYPIYSILFQSHPISIYPYLAHPHAWTKPPFPPDSAHPPVSLALHSTHHPAGICGNLQDDIRSFQTYSIYLNLKFSDNLSQQFPHRPMFCIFTSGCFKHPQAIPSFLKFVLNRFRHLWKKRVKRRRILNLCPTTERTGWERRRRLLLLIRVNWVQICSNGCDRSWNGLGRRYLKIIDAFSSERSSMIKPSAALQGGQITSIGLSKHA